MLSALLFEILVYNCDVMKLIFLDVDGVLNCSKSKGFPFAVDIPKVKLIHQIIRSTGVELVLALQRFYLKFKRGVK